MLLVILIAISAWILGMFLPWWSVGIPCLLFGAWLGENRVSSFGYGALGIGLLWGIQALVIHSANKGILSARIADLFNLPHPVFVILLTVFAGAIAGGISTMTGYLCKKVLTGGDRQS